jgi:hypothetical protein
MRKIFHILIAGLGTFLLLVVGQLSHVAAMQMPHEMSGMNHGGSTDSSQSCTTLCATSVVHLEKHPTSSVLPGDDEDLGLPYYLHLQKEYASSSTLKLQKPVSPDIPPKIPIYILYGVSRS